MQNCSRPLSKKITLVLWGWIDRLIRRLSGIRELGDGKASIWRLALRRYRGQDWAMKDGTLLRKGDYYLEVHINNDRLLALIDQNTSVERMGIITLREVCSGLPEVAKLMQSGQRYGMAKVLLGITLLHRGTERVGFTAYDLKPGFFRTATGWYEKMLLALFHPGGLNNLKRYRQGLSPKYVVMTRQEIMARYLPYASQNTNAPHSEGVASEINSK